MSTPSTPFSQRAGYTTAQICRLFGRSDGSGNVIPLHHNTIMRWRQAGQIPFFRVNQRTIRYPRTQIDALLDAKRDRAEEQRTEDWHRSREGELRGPFRL